MVQAHASKPKPFDLTIDENPAHAGFFYSPDTQIHTYQEKFQK